MVKVNPVLRNDLGLLEGVEYILNKDGGIDWRAMIPKDFLVFNLQHQAKIEEVYGKPITELNVTEVEDKYLLILLGGIKELARLRGYMSVTYDVRPVNEIFVSVACHINWIGNYETENRSVLFGDAADATNSNVDGFAKSYLTAIATNRAFVRAVKNFLGLNILGKDEIPEKSIGSQDNIENQDEATSSSPHVMLQRAMDSVQPKALTFEAVKNNCVKAGDESAQAWECVYDIPKSVVFDLLGRIKKKYGTN